MSVPPPAYGPASPYSSEPAYQAPPKKRGLKRIIFGALGIVANLIGLVVMPIVAVMIVAVMMVSNIEATSLGSPSATMETSGMSLYYVYVPSEEAEGASCSASSPSGTTLSDETSSEGLNTTVNGTSYSEVGSITATSDETIQITCDGASDVAVADVGMTGMLVGLGIGFGIPIILGIIALILLIWGIIARVRSSRAVNQHLQQRSQYPGYAQY